MLVGWICGITGGIRDDNRIFGLWRLDDCHWVLWWITTGSAFGCSAFSSIGFIAIHARNPEP